MGKVLGEVMLVKGMQVVEAMVEEAMVEEAMVVEVMMVESVQVVGEAMGKVMVAVVMEVEATVAVPSGDHRGRGVHSSGIAVGGWWLALWVSPGFSSRCSLQACSGSVLLSQPGLSLLQRGSFPQPVLLLGCPGDTRTAVVGSWAPDRML